MLSAITFQATGLYHKVYNNLELAEDEEFIAQMRQKFPLMDASMYGFIYAGAKGAYSSLEAIRKGKEEELCYIERSLKKGEFKTMRQKTHRFCLERKYRRILETKDKDIAFGGKANLRGITSCKQRLKDKNAELKDVLKTRPKKPNEKAERQQKIDLLKKEIKKTKESLEKFTANFKKNRIYGLYIIGRACEGGNRKVDFDLLNNKATLKLNAKDHIELTLIPQRGKKTKKEMKILQQAIDNNEIAVTARITEHEMHLSFDEQKLNGFAFNKIACKNKIKELGLKEAEDKKAIYRDFYKEQEHRFFADKIGTRYAAIDQNPYEISLVIADKVGEQGKFNVLFERVFEISELSTKLGLPSDDPKQIRQNNKRKTEIANIWTSIFEMLTHFKVGNFIREDLNLKPKTSAEKEFKEFNRQTKNVWHRQLSNELITKHTNILGIKLIGVEPCYSSFIGNMIYNKYDPIAAAYELLRRGIVKYIPGRKFFPGTSRICSEKLTYLKSKNIEINSWAQLFKKCTLAGLRYRNKDKETYLCQGHYLNSRKSKVKILAPPVR